MFFINKNGSDIDYHIKILIYIQQSLMEMSIFSTVIIGIKILNYALFIAPKSPLLYITYISNQEHTCQFTFTPTNFLEYEQM